MRFKQCGFSIALVGSLLVGCGSSTSDDPIASVETIDVATEDSVRPTEPSTESPTEPPIDTLPPVTTPETTVPEPEPEPEPETRELLANSIAFEWGVGAYEIMSARVTNESESDSAVVGASRLVIDVEMTPLGSTQMRSERNWVEVVATADGVPVELARPRHDHPSAEADSVLEMTFSSELGDPAQLDAIDALEIRVGTADDDALRIDNSGVVDGTDEPRQAELALVHVLEYESDRPVESLSQVIEWSELQVLSSLDFPDWVEKVWSDDARARADSGHRFLILRANERHNNDKTNLQPRDRWRLLVDGRPHAADIAGWDENLACCKNVQSDLDTEFTALWHFEVGDYESIALEYRPGGFRDPEETVYRIELAPSLLSS